MGYRLHNEAVPGPKTPDLNLRALLHTEAESKGRFRTPSPLCPFRPRVCGSTSVYMMGTIGVRHADKTQCNRQYPCNHCTRRRRPEDCLFGSPPAPAGPTTTASSSSPSHVHPDGLLAPADEIPRPSQSLDTTAMIAIDNGGPSGTESDGAGGITLPKTVRPRLVLHPRLRADPNGLPASFALASCRVIRLL